MRVFGVARGFLTRDEIYKIHEGLCRVLSEVGMRIENARLLKAMKKYGYEVDFSKETVYFPKSYVEEMITEGNGTDEESEEPSLRFNAGGYPHLYMDPRTDEVKPHTFDSSLRMAKVADNLENITSLNCIGLPSDVPLHAQTFYMKLLSWMSSRKPYYWGEVPNVKYLPYYVELCERYCDHTGEELKTVANIVIHKPYPLFLDRVNAEIIVAAREIGLPVGSGSGIPSIGGTAPVTLAGALVMQLADTFSDALMNQALSGRRLRPSFGVSLGVMDMRTGLNCACHPESLLLGLAMADMARFYGGRLTGMLSGKTQAKTLASVQSGFERGVSMMIGVVAGVKSYGSVGLISEPDGLNSAVQLVIDDEIAAIVKRFARGFTVDEDTLAIDVIEELGHKAFFLGHKHTVRHFRRELWIPKIFIGGLSYQTWRQMGGETEIDKAREKAIELWEAPPPKLLDDDCVRDLMELIKKAEKELLHTPRRRP